MEAGELEWVSGRVLLPSLLALVLAATPARGASQDSVPLLAPDTSSADGARIGLPVTLDLSAVGLALGSFQGSLRFDPSILTYVGVDQGDFAGAVEFNTDSVAAGLLAFAGANADSTVNRGWLPIIVLTVDVAGLGGEVSEISVALTELVTAGGFVDLTPVVTGGRGRLIVDPGPLRLGLVPDSTGARSGEITNVDLRLDLTGTVATPGAFQGTLAFDPAVARVDSVRPGDFGGTLGSNLDPQADSGFVRWAVLSTDAAIQDTVVLATFHLTAVGVGLEATDVVVSLTDAVNGSNLASLLPFVDVGDAWTFTVVFDGLWGDSSLSWQNAPDDAPVTALDALVCLAHVVGRDVSPFDPTGCDVAPDDGPLYDGTVTSLDALVILTFVVAGDTSGYRVGGAR